MLFYFKDVCCPVTTAIKTSPWIFPLAPTSPQVDIPNHTPWVIKPTATAHLRTPCIKAPLKACWPQADVASLAWNGEIWHKKVFCPGGRETPPPKTHLPRTALHQPCKSSALRHSQRETATGKPAQASPKQREIPPAQERANISCKTNFSFEQGAGSSLSL